MTILVVGATGATGRLLVQELLNRGEAVRAVVRSPSKLPAATRAHEGLSLIQASVLDLSDAEMAGHVAGCDAVASCLGHRPNLRGIWGPPYRLVTEATRRLCGAVKANTPLSGGRPVKFVLMNTVGNRNRDLDGQLSLGDKLGLGLSRLLLPPQADNEQAADYLRAVIGQNDPTLEWVAVRPTTLIDEERVSEYEVHPSLTESPLFGSAKTSRINVAHFMADLITEAETWKRWKGQVPVVSKRTTGSVSTGR